MVWQNLQQWYLHLHKQWFGTASNMVELWYGHICKVCELWYLHLHGVDNDNGKWYDQMNNDDNYGIYYGVYNGRMVWYDVMRPNYGLV